MRIEFVDCTAAWMPVVLDFFKRCYGPTYRLAVDQRLFRWQFGGVTPGPGGYHLKLATRDGVVLACLGFVPVELNVAGRAFQAAWTANWMVAPEHRRLGLGPLLLKHLISGFDAVLSLGLERDAVELLPRMGWADFGDLPRHVRVLDRAAAASLAGVAAAAVTRGSAQPAPPPAVSARALDDESAAVWDRVWRATGAGTRRTAGFLNWRYTRHPVFDYHALVSQSGSGAANGFVVYRVEQVRDMPVTVARIVELAGDANSIDGLVTAVVEHARAAGVAVLDFFCSSPRFDSALADGGFVSGNRPEVQDIPLLFQPINRERAGIRFMGYLAKLPAAAARHDWYVTKGDGDQDRPN